MGYWTRVKLKQINNNANEVCKSLGKEAKGVFFF